MKRRAFIAGLSSAAAVWTLAARAQQVRRVRRIAVLVFGSSPSKDFELIRELERIGYIDGRDIVYTIQGANGDVDRLPQLARDLVAASPEVIVGSSTPVAFALLNQTRDIPIVMLVVGDPVALGLTDRLARPSRNVTGFTMSSPTIAGKRLALLRELAPNLRKVGYLWVTASPLVTQFREEVRTAAEQFGIELVSLPVKSGPDISAAFEIAEKKGVEAILVEADPLAVRYSGTITDECVLRNLPAMHAWPFEVQLGALIAYGPSTTEDFPGAANYIDRILKGAKIVDLPFQEPTQFSLAINLRTARSIGLNVPAALLARADEVIE
jgi:putative tryptophan/tyrosine transport system substrate-binding protein